MFFFFNDTATTEIYTLSLHDALPICGAGYYYTPTQTNSSNAYATTAPFGGVFIINGVAFDDPYASIGLANPLPADRKSTRLNSSHLVISYAVFCLKKKKL